MANGTDDNQTELPTEELKDDAPAPNLDSYLWGNAYVDAYMNFADQYSHDNHTMNMSGMYCLLGQALRDVELYCGGDWTDGRIHVLAVQESGTGKDAAFNFLRLIARGAHMVVDDLASTTTAGLIGTVEKSGDITYGSAYDSDIIGMKEASTLFQTAKTEHSGDLVNYLNQIVDKEGHVKKRLGHGVIEYNSRASFFGTTYPPRDGIKYIREGLIARMVVSFRHVDEDYHDRVFSRRSKQWGKHLTGDPGALVNLSATLELLKTIKGDYFAFEEGSENVMGSLIQKIRSEYNDSVRETAKPFLNRMQNNMVKFAMCHAALDRMSKTITREHYKQALVYAESVWRGILEFIDKYRTSETGDKRLATVEKAVRELTEDGKNVVTSRDVLRRTRLTSSEVQLRLGALVEMGVIYTEKVTPSGPLGGRPSLKIHWKGYAGEKEAQLVEQESKPQE